MARPLRLQYPGAHYPMTSRGNEREAVFKSDRDREKFLACLESATECYHAVIHACCLPGSHFGISEASLSPASRRLHQPCKKDKNLRGQVDMMVRILEPSAVSACPLYFGSSYNR